MRRLRYIGSRFWLITRRGIVAGLLFAGCLTTAILTHLLYYGI